ncbi:hypothetical protein ACYSNU_01515 [Enterococcus sp. LJL120]
MATLESTKLSIELTPFGSEKITKQHFNDVVLNPDPEAIQKLGEIMHQISPEDTTYLGTLKTEVTRYEPI